MLSAAFDRLQQRAIRIGPWLENRKLFRASIA
jgi:hypothetical protein